MHVVGAVHGDVAVALHHHLAAGDGYRIGRQVLALEFELHGDHGAWINEVQRIFFFITPARVGVELAVDQLGHGVAAIAGDADQFAARRRRQLAADDQQPVLVAGNEALDHDFAAFGLGHVPRGLDVLSFAQVERDAACVVAVRRFDHHR